MLQQADTVPFQQVVISGESARMVNAMRAEAAAESLRKESARDLIKTLKNFNYSIYRDFIKLMTDFKTKDNFRVDILIPKAKKLFENCPPKFLLDFNAFLPKGYEINIPLPIVTFRKRKRDDYGSSSSTSTNGDHHEVDVVSQDCSKLYKAVSFVNKVRERLREDNRDGDDVFLSFLDVFLKHQCNNKRVKTLPAKKPSKYNEDERRIYKEVKALMKGYPDLVIELVNHFLPTLPLPALSSFIDSNCVTCTPSYSLRPKYYPIPATTQIQELHSRLLNDRWICINKIYLKELRKAAYLRRRRKGLNSKHEEEMFKWEDERFELDRKVSCVNSASDNVEKLLKKIEDDNPSIICIEDHLSELNLSCIRALSNELGLKVMDEVKRNIRAALPLMRNLLENHKQNLRQSQSIFNQEWAEFKRVNNWN